MHTGLQKILSHGELAGAESRQLPANKTDELFQQKTLLRVLLFRVQTKQTHVHNNAPANDRKIYIQHRMNVDWLAICLRVVSFKKSPWAEKIQ